MLVFQKGFLILHQRHDQPLISLTQSATRPRALTQPSPPQAYLSHPSRSSPHLTASPQPDLPHIYRSRSVSPHCATPRMAQGHWGVLIPWGKWCRPPGSGGDRGQGRIKSESVSCSVWLFVTPWTGACLAPLSMGFSRQEYRSRLSSPFPGDLADPGIDVGSPALQANSIMSKSPGKPLGGGRGRRTGRLLLIIWILYPTLSLITLLLGHHCVMWTAHFGPKQSEVSGNTDIEDTGEIVSIFPFWKKRLQERTWN